MVTLLLPFLDSWTRYKNTALTHYQLIKKCIMKPVLARTPYTWREMWNIKTTCLILCSAPSSLQNSSFTTVALMRNLLCPVVSGAIPPLFYSKVWKGVYFCGTHISNIHKKSRETAQDDQCSLFLTSVVLISDIHPPINCVFIPLTSEKISLSTKYPSVFTRC